jgi:hypothetical protein
MIEEIQIAYYGAMTRQSFEARLTLRGMIVREPSGSPDGQWIPLPPREFETLSALILRASCQEWNDRYEAGTMDTPKAQLTIAEDGCRRSILCDIGEGPDSLRRVIRWIQRLVWSAGRECEMAHTRTVAETAAFLGVTENDIVAAIRGERLRACIVDTGGAGEYRLPIDQFRRFVLGLGAARKRMVRF